jgi:hypothetical protein
VQNTFITFFLYFFLGLWTSDSLTLSNIVFVTFLLSYLTKLFFLALTGEGSGDSSSYSASPSSSSSSPSSSPIVWPYPFWPLTLYPWIPGLSSSWSSSSSSSSSSESSSEHYSPKELSITSSEHSPSESILSSWSISLVLITYF